MVEEKKALTSNVGRSENQLAAGSLLKMSSSQDCLIVSIQAGGEHTGFTSVDQASVEFGKRSQQET